MSKQWHQLEKLDHKSLKKVQQERQAAAKAAQADAEKKKILLGVGVVLFCIVVVVVFFVVVRSRQAQQARSELRQRMLRSEVTEVKGRALMRNLGGWEPVKKGMTFDQDMMFKTEADGFVTIHLNHGDVGANENEKVAGNLLKMHPNSELEVARPTLHDDENKVIAETARLNRGELTVEMSQTGRELLSIEVGPLKTRGLMGRYKLIYDREKQNGELVVKNGLVETRSPQSERPINVTGFYKVVIKQGVVGNPEQAAVINYNWL